ncbi:hypothetical protein VOLCADRAFT_90912 [Volvox carteri f. nagariensis]|uniref:Uncharacterized protein n=1 Tax=Volvox carteri f. nagariensis TaxID=3068 RepID=D8TVE3_VOLCA|nr:uncharacterized protein VOLCADRAFT_90912 [Volvox carteri f. nagariensis]EFJ48561.1 hypothetical protein VOLCADRAFT_90912 [Volvox carteri f. nagariensis]|eukprot:XP_002950360.1 hypothetical protein VOLCADRAFT_90912 [Volvox carteri f. nagariensis]
MLCYADKNVQAPDRACDRGSHAVMELACATKRSAPMLRGALRDPSCSAVRYGAPTRTTLDKHCTLQCASNCVVQCTLNCALNCTFNCMSSCVVGCALKRASRHMSNCAVRCGQCLSICAFNRGAVRCGAVRCGACGAVWRGAVQCGAVRCGTDTEAVHSDARGRIARAQAWSGAVRDDAVWCGAVRCGAVRCGARSRMKKKAKTQGRRDRAGDCGSNTVAELAR